MKTKTANIRMLGKGIANLKTVNVKKFLEFADEQFFIHRRGTNSWAVSHYTTGLRVCEGRTITIAEEKFKMTMDMHAHMLQTSISDALNRYGAANKKVEI